MYALVMQRLDEAGYEQYEISNWALKPGVGSRESGVGEEAREQRVPARLPTADSRLPACAHNLLYWRNANWLGIGPSAASHVAGWRWKNEPHLGRYIDGCPTPPIVDHEHLPANRRVGEQLMLALRLREGVALSWLDDQLPADDPRHADIRHLTDLGFLETTPTHLRLTYEGLFVADSVIAKLL
jgi:oxygen-independent coproporphyrinogen-3 oxidase